MNLIPPVVWAGSAPLAPAAARPAASIEKEVLRSIVQSCVKWLLRCRTKGSIRRVIGETRVLAPTDSPDIVSPRHNQYLAAAHDLVWRPFISRQGAAVPHNRRVRPDEGQLFQSFALHAVPEDRAMHFCMPLFDCLSPGPDPPRPEYPDPVLVKQVREGLHVMRVPRILHFLKDGDNFFATSVRRRRLSRRFAG